MNKILLGILLLFSINVQAATLRFATEATYPPFEYIDAKGELQGFDIAIAKALCVAMQVECSISHQAFSSLIPSLKMGKYDALIAALGATPERAKEVAFSHAYYTPSASFVASKAAHYRLKDLLGKTVGVQAGSIFRDYLVHTYANKMQIKFYASIQEAFLDLQVGRLDAVLADTPIASAFIQSAPMQFAIVEKPIMNASYFGSGYAIAVRKDNQSLLKSINKALIQIKRQGTYQKLLKTYLGVKS